ncbi:hypothetical protein BGZ54_003171 [Gamsiella multidivaricata]|nr:hypothetical protein BGZ54_003171 [Gamsiella multidivaricata]
MAPPTLPNETQPLQLQSPLSGTIPSPVRGQSSAALPSATLPSSIITTAAITSAVQPGQPSPAQPSPVSPTGQKPTSLQILRQQQMIQQQRQLEQQRQQQLEKEMQEQLEKERQEQLVKEQQQQQEQERQLQQQQSPQTLPFSQDSQSATQAPFSDTSNASTSQLQSQWPSSQGTSTSVGQPSTSNNARESGIPQQGQQGQPADLPSHTEPGTGTSTGGVPIATIPNSDPIGGNVKTEEEIMPPPPPPPITASTGPGAGAQSSQPPPQKPKGAAQGGGVKIESRPTPAASVAAAPTSGSPQIFKATYSGVPVFEMICKGVAVMRRRSDSYLNATQILKVADFDKPQRTRILEREVQKGEHEKVQGGYGKYQGTWVPLERGVQLCQEYNVVHLLQPLLDYQATQTSPPLAPKHITAASNRPRKPREPRALDMSTPGNEDKPGVKPRARKTKRKAAAAQILPKPSMGANDSGANFTGGPGALGEERETSLATEGDEDMDDGSTSTGDDGDDSDESEGGTMSLLSGHTGVRTRTPSPTASRPDLSSEDVSDRETSFSSASTSTSPAKRRRRPPSLQDRSLSSLRKRHVRPGDELFIGFEDKQVSRRKRARQKSNKDVDMESGSHMEDNDDDDNAMDVDDDDQDTAFQRDSSPSVRSKTNRRSTSRTRASDQDDRKSTLSSTATAIATGSTSVETQSRGPYADTLLEYFIADTLTLPKILTEPPADLDFNIVIDGEGHTSLHWAAAMAKLEVVKILVQNGADTYRVNADGQTALMRSVLFSNNFEEKTFAVLLEVLQKTIFTIDKDDQTVFHHVTNTAGQRGKIHAARYYLECLLEKLAQHPSELASIINVQDRVGDTALTIASRLKVGGKKVVKMLVDAGADLKIRNHTGKNAEEYLLETDQQQQIASSADSKPSAGAEAESDGQRQQGSIRNSGTSAPASVTRAKDPHVQPVDKGTRSQDQPYGHPLTATSAMLPPPPPLTLLPSAPRLAFAQPASGSSSGLLSQLQQANSWPGTTTSVRLPGGPPVSSSSQAVIPTVSELFSKLTQSYEKDIFEKDQDIQEARGLLQGIQTEIREGHRTIHELKLKTVTLGQAEEQIKALEGLLKQEIHERQRLRLQELISQEEERLRNEVRENEVKKNVEEPKTTTEAEKTEGNVNKNEEEFLISPPPPPPSTANAAGSGVETVSQSKDDITMGSTAIDATSGVLETTIAPVETTTTTTTDAASVIADEQGANPASAQPPALIVSSSKLEELENEVEQLRTKLSELQQRRKDRVVQIVDLKRQQGKRWYEYQRLIALCCNVAIDQVDELLGPLLSSLSDGDEIDV